MRNRTSFVVVVAAFAVAMAGTTLPTPLYAVYRPEFGFSKFLVTVIFATYAIGVIGGLLGFGRASDEFGRRPVLLAGLALSALSAAIFLVAQSTGPLFAGRLVSGVSAGIFTGTATATLVDLASEDGRGRATLLATLANMLGLGAGPLLAGALSELFSDPLRLVFVVDIVLIALVALALTRIPEPATPSERPRLRPQGLAVPAETRSTFVPAALAAFAGFAVLGLFTALAPAVLSELLGVSDRAAIGAVVLAVFVGSATGQASAGSLDSERAQKLGCLLLAVGTVVLGAGVASRTPVPFVLGGVLAGVGQGMSFRSGLGAVNAAAPGDQRGAVASSFFVVAYVALAIPVVGVGVLQAAVGLRTAGTVFAAVVALLALATVALLEREHRVSRDDGRGSG